MGHIERLTTETRTGKTRHDRAAIITSLNPDQASSARLLELVRGHWSIENRSHWVRDVTFDRGSQPGADRPWAADDGDPA